MRILLVSGFVLAVHGTESLAQEESCVSALQSRIRAGEAVMDAMPRLEANCSELKGRLDAFIAAESALKKSDKSVRRACPAGEFVRADSDRSVRFQFILEVVKKRLANCPEPARK
jgi:hypothetical protein